MLTRVQSQVLAAVEKIGVDGWPVGVREIMAVTGHASPSTVWMHLRRLEEAGAVVRNPRGREGWKVTPS